MRMKRKLDLSKLLPPGLSARSELGALLTVVILTAVGYGFGYLIRLFDAYGNLFTYRMGERVLGDGALMPTFLELFEGRLDGLLLLIVCLPLLAVYHYIYHYQGSKSIYLMRRLPNRLTLHRRCWTVPVLAAVGLLLLAGVLFLLDLGLYYWITPQECLPLQSFGR